MGKLKIGAQAPALSVGISWAAGAESRQGSGQEAALGQCELIPLLNPCLNGHRLEILKEAKRQALCCLIPMALDFQRNLSMQKDFFLLHGGNVFSVVSFSYAVFSSP